MHKVEVTEQLSRLLKELRIKYGIKSQELALFIEKSPAYISKLENSEIKTIDLNALEKILLFITKLDAQYEEMLNIVIRTLSIQFDDPKEIEKQIWFLNFDQVRRTIKVSQELVNAINLLIKDNDIELTYLIDRINSNENLADEIACNKSYKFNIWYDKYLVDHKDIIFKDNESGSTLFIKMQLDVCVIEKILNLAEVNTNFITLLSIVFYLKKIYLYGETKEIDAEAETKLWHASYEFLENYGYYSLIEKNKKYNNKKDKEYLDLLESIGKTNMKEILEEFKRMAEYDQKYTNEKLGQFKKSLSWDITFMFKILGFDYFNLGKLSYKYKKDFLLELDELLAKYKSMPDDKFFDIY